MSIQKAAQDIKILASRLKPLLEVAEVLEEIGSLEQASREAKKRKDESYKLAKQASLAVEAAEADLAKIKEQTAIASKNLKGLEVSAKDKAAEIVKNAEISAKEIIDSAIKKKTEIDKTIEKSSEKLTSIKSDIATSYAELSSIQGQISEMRAKIAAFVGGA